MSAAHADEALRQALAQPTLASRLLAETARQLARYRPHHPLHPTAWGAALARGVHHTLDGLPEVIQNRATAAAVTALPAARPGETAGEYALRLHAAARTV